MVLVRGLLAIAALAGCGRLGFDEDSSTPAPPTPDAPVDGTTGILPDICNAREAGPIELVGGEVATKLRATQLSGGNAYAVAIETSATNVYVARVAPTGELISQHAPMNVDYALHGIAQITTRPFIYVFTSGGGYIKMLTVDWDSYETGPSGDEFKLDPQQALLPNESAALAGVITGGVMSIQVVDITGPTGLSIDYAPPATHGSFASTPSGVRVVSADDGACETVSIDPDGVTGTPTAIMPCEEPVIAMVDDTRGAILYRTAPGGDLAVYSLADQTTTPLGPGQGPRIAVHDGAIWVAHLAGGGLRIHRFDGHGPPTTKHHPAIGSVFDLLPTALFWVDAGILHVGDPCP